MTHKQRLTKAERRERRQERRQKNQGFHTTEPVTADYSPKRNSRPLEARTEAQGHYIIAINDAKLTFGVGPAGTGKTYVCGALAIDALEGHQTEKIVITRPAIEAGESLGFLPGEVEDKYEPYLQPFRDVFYERMGKGTADYMIKAGRIEPAPIAFMRGRTFKDCWVILDEAQNLTPSQMKMFLTRIGENCKVIVNGDINQTDIEGANGLTDAIDRLRHLNQVRVVEFGTDDVVRSGLVQHIVKAYEGH